MFEANADDRLRDYMFSLEMQMLDERTREESARIREIKSKEEGREEEAREFVLRMFNRNYDMATISDLTGLSLDEVKVIIKSVTN
jgi:hypothetical protein